MTIYLFRVIATIAASIPFLRYIYRFATKLLPEDADWMTKDTKIKARLIILIHPAMFVAMTITAIFSVDNYYFGNEFIVSVVVLALTIIFNIIHWWVNKKEIKTKLYPLIKLFQVILPTVYLLVTMFVIKINK